LIALIAPPNTWDSLAYHMSRVVHWMQDRSVAHYPTNIVRQIYTNPWAEFAIMHLQILSKGDRFANLVQWFSMAGSIIGVSLIAGQLGASAAGQILAAVICATIPMAILQSSSTQNDLTVSFWLVCCVYNLIEWRNRPSRGRSLAVGASLGLAVLTKATAYLYAPPFLAWIFVSALRKHGRAVWKPALLAVLIALAVNLGHYTRNFRLFGHPIRPGSQVWLHSCKAFTPRFICSKLVRNIGLHMGTPFPRLNAPLEKAMRAIDSKLGIEAKDPRPGWFVPHYVPITSYNENFDGNPLHLILIAVSITAMLSLRRLRKSHDLPAYLLCLLAAFLLFNFYVRRSSWNSRLHLALFVLSSPLTALVLLKTFPAPITNGIAVVLIIAAFPWVLFNEYRPLAARSNVFNTTRLDQYFTNNPKWREPYKAAARFLTSRNRSNIGLCLSRHDWEYPLWVLLRRNGGRPVRLEHVNVNNTSNDRYAAPPFNNFVPDAVVAVRVPKGAEMDTRWGLYRKEWESQPITVFLPR